MAVSRRASAQAKSAISRLSKLVAHQWDAQTLNAQAEISICLAVARLLEPDLSPQAWSWALGHLPTDTQSIAETVSCDPLITEAAAEVCGAWQSKLDPLAFFFEHLLNAHDRAQRRRHGVFYTPPEIARFIIRFVDRTLREEFSLKDGLLDAICVEEAIDRGLPPDTDKNVPLNQPLIRILDPALGAGVFLTEILHFARRQLTSADDWNRVAPSLLRRLGGIELLPGAAGIAIVRIAATLMRTGYAFASDAQITLHIGDALAAPIRPPWTVVIGNPPFSGISSAKHPWLLELLRGRGPGEEQRASYFEFNGVALGERKHWLHDDYVKFFRIAHEQVEAAGFGIVGLVTSHGYFDNVSFRAMRQQLQATFPRVAIVDLHGSAKRREKTPEGARDENVFGIEAGVAIGLFRRPLIASPTEAIRADVWGSRESKLQALEADDLPWTRVSFDSSEPSFADRRTASEHEAGWPIDEAMPVHSTAPVTARDAFVIARTRAELEARCRDFCDPSVSDDEIRARYFTRTRSPLYAAGDTRGWKLAEARRRMQQTDWQLLIHRVLYRPLDERFILWAPWMIDWPRGEVTSHLVGHENLTLITRRQAPPNMPWTYAWVTDNLALDGVIRSDNRGSESLFPLWLYSAEGRVANFSPRFIADFEAATGLFCGAATTDQSVFCPEDLLAYIYALLSCTAYRQRYQAQLTSSFPRVSIPRSKEVFQRLALAGRRLFTATADRVAVRYVGSFPTAIDTGFPRYESGRVWLNKCSYLSGISSRTWQWRVGTYQVCLKYLKSWRGQTLDEPGMRQIIAALTQARRYAASQTLIDRWAVRGVDFGRDFLEMR